MRLKQALIVMATLGVLLFFPVVSVQAQGTTPEAPKWWEVAAGIISIPATIIGIVYSYVLIGKSRLEMRKTELEIAEKQRTLAKLTPREKSTVEDIIKPVVKSQQIQALIPSFIILYLILSFWGLIEYGFLVLSTAIAAWLSTLLNGNDTSNAIIVLLSVLNALPTITRYLILFALGWPLFKDANSTVGLNLTDLFTIKRTKN